MVKVLILPVNINFKLIQQGILHVQVLVEELFAIQNNNLKLDLQSEHLNPMKFASKHLILFVTTPQSDKYHPLQ